MVTTFGHISTKRTKECVIFSGSCAYLCVTFAWGANYHCNVNSNSFLVFAQVNVNKQCRMKIDY